MPRQDGRSILLCYVRKSVVKQASDEVPPAIQRRALLAEAEAGGYTSEFYEDIEGHSSGANEKQRPGWRALKAQWNRPDIAGVAVYSLSRGWRNVRNFLNDLADLEKRRISLICVKEKLDTGSAIGRLLVTVLMSMYAFESEVASERMSETIHFKREHGRTWGMAPFGTIRTDGVLQPDPTHLPTLRQLFTLFATGDYGTDALAEEMNLQGYPFRDRNGTPRDWRRDDCRRTLSAWRIYAGEVPVSGRAKDDPDDWMPGSHSPILSEELCLQVGQELQSRSRPGRPRVSSRHEFLLSGVLYCHCGQQLSGIITRHGVPVYRHRIRGDCRSRKLARAEEIEALVLEQINTWRLSEDDKERLIDIVKERSAELRALLGQAPDASTLRAQYHLAKERYARLKELRIEGEISREEYYRRRDPIKAELERLGAMIEERAEIFDLDIDDLLERIGRLDRLIGFLGGNAAQKKLSIDTLVSRVVVFDNIVTKIEPQPWVSQLAKQATDEVETPGL